MKLILGIGCDRGASLETLAVAVDQALALIAQPRAAVTALASIDKKNDEIGLLALSTKHDWPMFFFSAEQLAEVTVPNPSEIVRKHMGTPAVAEAAALLAANTGIENLILEKHKHRGDDGKNATVSIARLVSQ